MPSLSFPWGLFGRVQFRQQKPTWSWATLGVQRLRLWGGVLSSFTLVIFPYLWAPQDTQP